MQHIARSMCSTNGINKRDGDPSTRLLIHTVGVERIKCGLEGLDFCKSNMLYPTYARMQKTWNKVRQLQQITGFTPIWSNAYYPELVRLKYGARWTLFVVTHLRHVFAHGRLGSFADLRERFRLPDSILFYYMQIHHTIKARGPDSWIQSPSLIFNYRYMYEVDIYKGLIS